MRRLAPLYIPTSDPASWDDAINRLGVTDLVVFNPDNGPGRGLDAQWQGRALQARGRGLMVTGYTPISYGRNVPAAMQLLDRWRAWYGVRSVFVDEFPSNVESMVGTGTPITFLEAIILLARRVASPGGSSSSSNAHRVILNPGTVPTAALVDRLPDAVWVVHEGRDSNGPSVDDVGRPPCSFLPPMSQGWISYNDPDPQRTMARLAELGWGYGWSTSDPAPRGNPYDNDPST